MRAARSLRKSRNSLREAVSLRRSKSSIGSNPFWLRNAARTPCEAQALIYGLLTEQHQAVADGQAAVLVSHAGQGALDLVRELLPLLGGLAADARLVLAQLALPALRQLPEAEQSAFSATCQALIEYDAQLSYFEFALQKMVLRHLVIAGEPAAVVTQIYSFNAVVAEIAVLLSALAWAGALQKGDRTGGVVAADTRAAEAAFRDGASQLPLISAQLALLSPDACGFDRLDPALDKLSGASFPIKHRLLLACAQTVTHDNEVRDEEAELLRAFAASLGCPMPPLLAG